MSFYTIVFYILTAITILATALAITRRNAVHAVIYLVISFFSTALIFYLLGAPFLALLEVIIYAGAIMVLFLFIVMTIRPPSSTPAGRAVLRQWAPAAVLGAISLGVAAAMIFTDPGGRSELLPAMAGPRAFGQFVFEHYWFQVEIASFLLLIALVGAFYLGRREEKTGKGSQEAP